MLEAGFAGKEPSAAERQLLEILCSSAWRPPYGSKFIAKQA